MRSAGRLADVREVKAFPLHPALQEGVPIETRGQVQACAIQLADVREVNALGLLEVRVPELAEGIAAQALTALLFGLPGG